MLDKDHTPSYKEAATYCSTCKSDMPKELRETYINYLMNQCIRFINKNINRVYYANEYITYLDWLDEEGYLVKNNQLAPTKYQLGISAGLAAGQLKWLDKFVQKMQTPELYGNNGDFIRALFKAEIAFHKQQVDEAHTLIKPLHGNKSVGIFYNIFYYKLYIQIFFMRGEFDPTIAKLEAFRKYLSRALPKGSITKEKIGKIREFINFVLKVIKLRQDPNSSKVQLEKLNNDFQQKKEKIAYSKWIEETIIQTAQLTRFK